MNPGVRLMLGLAAAATAAALGAWILARLQSRRRKTPQELERIRRLEVNRLGRIAAGQVMDLVEPGAHGTSAHLLVYRYEVAGVSYEVAQDISALPHIVARAGSLLGQAASVKYDPQRPTNSIIACEEWSGLRD